MAHSAVCPLARLFLLGEYFQMERHEHGYQENISFTSVSLPRDLEDVSYTTLTTPTKTLPDKLLSNAFRCSEHRLCPMRDSVLSGQHFPAACAFLERQRAEGMDFDGVVGLPLIREPPKMHLVSWGLPGAGGGGGGPDWVVETGGKVHAKRTPRN